MPRAHIVLCTYNPHIAYFDAQIASLSAQSHGDWRCSVVDDASDPEHRTAIAAIVARDGRFTTHFHDGRSGVYHNFERGLRTVPAESEFVFYCDQDDLWQRDKIERFVAAFDAAPDAVLVHCDLDLIDGEDRPVGRSLFAREDRNLRTIDCAHAVVRNVVTGCAAGFRTSLLADLLPFPQQEPGVRLYHDQWTAVVAAARGGIVTLPQALVLYRQHGSNVVGAETESVSETSAAHLRRLIGRGDVFGPLLRVWAPRRRLILALAAAVEAGRMRPSPGLQQLLGWTLPVAGPLRLAAAGFGQRRAGDAIGTQTLKFAVAEALVQLGGRGRVS